MSESASVSVAIATFNGERFLHQQFDSILTGHRLPDEIIVSDDGSTDASVELLGVELERARSLGIHALLTVNDRQRGVTANFAEAISRCSSDVIVLSDQDDVWHPARLARAARAFERDDKLLLRHENAQLVDADGAPLGVTLFEALGVSPVERSRINHGGGLGVYLKRNLATGATMSFRRELYQLAAPFPSEWVHDEWLAVVASVTGPVQVSDDVEVDYRQHGSNQIGVQEATLRYRIERMLSTSVARNRTLARRSQVLVDRLTMMTQVPDRDLEAVRRKALFENERALLSASRPLRIPTVMRASRLGGYRRFASQGRLDMVRDLIQRP